MRAIIASKYGTPEVLKLTILPKPKPATNELLIKVYATTVGVPDTATRSGNPFIVRFISGFFRPKGPLGDCFAGEVEAIGSQVNNFRPGDRVFGTLAPKSGTNQEYLTISENKLVLKLPEKASYADGAALADGYLTALPFLRDKGLISTNSKVLINGASGAVGIAAVQLAKYYGAHVTGVCSTNNTDLVKAQGADNVIDYTKEDFTKGTQKYDIIFDAVTLSTFAKCKNVLTPKGKYLVTIPDANNITAAFRTRNSVGKRAIFLASGLRKDEDKMPDLKLFVKLFTEGKIKPILGTRLPLEKLAEAHKLVETGHKVGNLIIDIQK